VVNAPADRSPGGAITVRFRTSAAVLMANALINRTDRLRVDRPRGQVAVPGFVLSGRCANPSVMRTIASTAM
jgi:hypothetical protein